MGVDLPTKREKKIEICFIVIIDYIGTRTLHSKDLHEIVKSAAYNYTVFQKK